MRKRLWRVLARVLGWLADLLRAWADARERAERFPRGTVVVADGGVCTRCLSGMSTSEWAVALWNVDTQDYSLRGIGEDGVASIGSGMAYACLGVKLRVTGRRVEVRS